MAIIKKTFTNVNDIEEEQIKSIVKGAALKDKSNNKVGRKKKPYGEKAKETMVVYFTVEQKELIQGYCDKVNVPFSNLIKQILVERNIL